MWKYLRILLCLASLVLFLGAAPPKPKVVVYKTATCGCCAKWVDHMKANGFQVEVNVVQMTAPHRQKAGIADKFGSCHTSFVGNYAIEGHVPAADIIRLLKEKPKAIGLAVPGMPLGSPGMESVRSDPYNTLLLSSDGSVKVFEKH